jgi:hypothetical protein
VAPVAGLEELAKREMALLEHAHSTVGLMEEKYRRLRESGAFAESAAIHSGYVTLAAPPTSDLEALKRAIFLGWYECSEPGCFTGIGNLDPREHRRAHELLDIAHVEGRVDSEFAVMLGWYWLIADYHFTAHSSDRLVNYVSRLDPVAYEDFGFTRASLEERGQMGRYWISIACRAT